MAARNKNYFLLFRDEDGVKFLENDNLSHWFEEFGEENFIGGACFSDLDIAYDLIELFLKFFDDFVHHTKFCRKIKGDPDQIETFLETKLGSILVPYKGNGSAYWKRKAEDEIVVKSLTA